ncbi:MAG: molybdopterin-dependent oxidoreductase [Clostridiales Family XIII bacterium]|jgi:aldehyde oxidoreductase|nr:molybdopterin-dependent oxidoreductase [Clostridiales Family XIII bacterium]
MNLKKMTLNINGADRMFICDPGKDTLATVLRRLGLTGVKVGCGRGVCGSCSVILDGKVIRSCTRKISAVQEYSEVTTIEGIGAPNYMHPLQVAFMENGAVQCGFCSPGFIVSAYQLLQEKADPTREEVRAWFAKHRNICRCTGYRQITDAVMDAAAVLRGEKTVDDIKVKMPEDKNYYGKPLVRPAALGKVTGLTDYGDDIELKMPGHTLHVVMVQPKVAHHAKILKINTEEAERMPGVYKVITHKDVKGSNRLCFFQFLPRTVASEQTHILLAEEKIFNYGDIIALVAADTKENARAAAAKVTLEYEKLPEVLSFLEAALPDAVRVHEDHPNIWALQPTIKGDEDVKALIDGAPNVVEGSFYSSREPHMPIEGDTVQAYWDEDGMLTVHCKAMAIYANIGDIAEATGVPAEKVRVVENPTGGTFGWGIAGATYSLAAIACMACDDRPVAFSMTYEEFMAYSGKRAPSYTNSRLACDQDGKIIAAEWDNGLDHGAYNELGDDLTTRVARFMYFPYNVPNCAGVSRVAATNHAYGTAYRGYGSPQAYTASEAIMDMMAEKLGISPWEIRWRNVARPGDKNINGYEFTDYPGEQIMKEIKPAYDAAVAAAKAFNNDPANSGKRRGVGLVWGGYNVTEGTADQCTVAVELAPDGRFVKYDTWQDQGQGGDIGSLMVTLEALRVVFAGKRVIDRDDVKLIQNDSKFCPDHGATASSRSHFMNSISTKAAVEKLYNAMLKPDGSLRSHDEMVAEGIPTRYENQFLNEEFGTLADLDPNTGVGNPTPDYTFAMFLSEVEVELSTGKTTVLGMHAVADVGIVGNIAAVKGQVFGGMSHTIGFALSENYDDVVKHNNILGAGIPTSTDIPDAITVTLLENHRRQNPFGSSGASEAFQSSGHMAVINAIADATGVRIYELPATADKVKAGIDALAAGGKGEAQQKYFLGSDFWELIEDIRTNPV